MTTNALPILSSITVLALLSLISQRHHILICLLSLEAALLSLAFRAALTSSSFSSIHLFYCILILSFGACEAAVALATLVLVSRSFGSDSIQRINLNKC